ncbi:MAG: hypothetical protein ACXWUL_08665 [Caldimonas sp.]
MTASRSLLAAIAAHRFGLGEADLAADLRAVLKGVLGDHLQLSSRALDRDVFPESEGVPALRLLRG